MARIQHLLLTRFNVPHPAYARDKRGAAARTPEWLEHRFGLFETFCLPSVRAQVDAETEFLITSRVDNDDALARDALGTVRRAFQEQTREFINLESGCILARGAVYRALLPCNPFLSLIERRGPEPWLTVWGVDHDRAREIGPVRNLRDRPYWLQVVHERNLTNAWGDCWHHALQPIKNVLRRGLTRLGLMSEREGWIERTRLTLPDVAERFGLRR